jgi:hypothetical protein
MLYIVSTQAARPSLPCNTKEGPTILGSVELQDIVDGLIT